MTLIKNIEVLTYDTFKNLEVFFNLCYQVITNQTLEHLKKN